MRSQQSILMTLINIQIPVPIITEAVELYETVNLGFVKKARVRHFLKDRTRVSETPLSEWPTRMLLKILVFHDQYIQFFVNDYTVFCLSKNPVSADTDSQYSPLSSSENLRIQRSFYRFQMYSNLFKKHRFIDKGPNRRPVLKHREQASLFLSRYTPWEVEELCCIHDYLYQRLSLSMDEVLRHSPQIAEQLDVYDILRVNNLNEEHKEGYLSHGLTFIHEILHTSEYDDWEIYYQNYLISAYEWFPKSVSIYDPSEDFALDYEEDQPANFDGDDNANGPNEAWLWSNDYTISWSAYDRFKSHLRVWGYTMWDSSRLSAWGILQKPYSVDEAYQKLKELDNTAEQQKAEVYRTAGLRTVVCQRGGRGYWTESESQIVWGNPRFPYWPDQRTGNPNEWTEPYPGVSTQVLYEIGEGLRSRLVAPNEDLEPGTAIPARKKPSLFSKLRNVLRLKRSEITANIHS